MDIEALLAPLPGDVPAGPDLSFSAEFDTIQELRRRDDPTLSQGEWVTDLKTADWAGMAALCAQLLESRTRDLRVAAWWTEAQAQLRGYAGLADGLTLTAALCERQWDELHPQPEDGEHELRVGSLSWLLAQVQAVARALPVLSWGGQALNLQQIEAARLLTAEAAAASGALGPEQVARALRDTPAARIGQARDDARRAWSALQQLQAWVDRQLGVEGPGFAAARQALETAVAQLERLARDAGLAPTAAAAGPGGEAQAAQPGVAAAAPAPVAGPLADRAQALQQLREVASFFRRTEPHSPVAYLADKAARWGEMPLHAWLRTVMKDPGALSQLEDLLGVEPPAGG